jgi:virulence-associated protein VapD
MKTKIITLLILLTTIVSAGAQDLLEMIKRDINAERRTIIAEALTIPLENETEFWHMYNEMEQELDLLTDKRAKNINKFADNYENVTDDVADELAKTSFEISSGRVAINKKYYKKAGKLITKKEAARFIQLLNQIQLIIDIQVAAEVPLIE